MMRVLVSCVHILCLSWMLIVFICLPHNHEAEALAGRSSGNRKKRQTSTSAGGGFGKQQPASSDTKNNLPAYVPDASQTTRDLVQYLVGAQECEGVGVEQGTEIGFCTKTGRRGLFAADNFQEGEFLLGIPFPCCLTLAKDDIAVGEPADPELGFRLLNLLSGDTTSDDDHEFGPYFKSFPTRQEHFDATPDFWTLPEIETLELPPIIAKAVDRKAEIEQLAQSQGVDVSELQFATWLVKSRGFSLLKPILTAPDQSEGDDDNDDEDTTEPQTTIISKTVLMPYLDMMNHNSPETANAELQLLETKAEDESMYALQATRPIRKGSEITLTYGTGQESSAEMLSNYGFVPKRNPNDSSRSFLKEEWGNHRRWSTTLEDDEATLKNIIEDGRDNVMKKVLEFRIQMKRSSLPSQSQ